MLLRKGIRVPASSAAADGHFQQAGFGIEPQIHGHLVVPAAAHMHPLAEIAQLFRQAALDRQMHILVCPRNGETSRGGIGQDLPQSGDHALRIFRGQQGRLDRQAGQHRHMRGRAHAIGLDQRQIQHAVLPGRVGQDLRVHFPHRCFAPHPSAGSA